MPISIKDIPESTKKLLEWKWKQRGFKVSFPEFLALYVYAYNKAEEYGFSDPEITVLELLDKVDPDLSYDELKEEIEGFLVPISVTEFEELEYWKKKAQELEREIKKAVPYSAVKRLEEKIKKLERMIEEREKEIEELKKKQVRQEIRELTREFEEELKEYPTDELVTSYYALKTKPPELSEEEWIARREAIKRELERRKVPKSPITGDFLEPVTEWKGVRVPPELGFWYDPVDRRFYRDGRPVTPETIEKSIRTLLKPIEIEKPLPAIYKAPPEATPIEEIEEELELPPAFRPGELPPDMKQIRSYLKLISGFIIRMTGKEPEELPDEVLERILNKLQPYYPRQVYYFKWYITTFRDWRERGLF